MSSLFNKKLIRSCSWCKHGRKSEYTDEIYCTKHGVTDKRDYCRSYKYDPLKREPERLKPADGYSEKDFEL